MVNFFKKYLKLWFFFFLKFKFEIFYNIVSLFKNFLLKGYYECNCCILILFLLLIDGIYIKGYDIFEF